MQLVLNVDNLNFDDTIGNVFAALTEDDKRDIARQCMLEVLRNPSVHERQVEEERVALMLVDQEMRSSYPSFKTTQDAKASYKFREAMAKYKTSTEQMVEMIVQATVKNYKELVEELVKEDEQLKEIYALVRDQAAKDFPRLIEACMISYFSAQMGNIGAALNMSANTNMGVGILVTQLKNELAARGININI